MEKGDFIYLDPPYNPTNPTSNFTSYTENAYGDHDQEQLASIFEKLDERQHGFAKQFRYSIYSRIIRRDFMCW